MSELRGELVGAGINKKRVITVILVAVLLISVFAFSTALFSFLFNTQRVAPSKQKSETEYEEAELILPPPPFDLRDLLEDLTPEQLAELMELFEDLTPEQLAELMDQVLSEMLDGGIDDLDLSDFSKALLALLGSQAGQQEVFRVYDYDSINSMTNKLWRYECFDEFTGEAWHSTAATNFYDFYSYSNYSSKYSYLDLIRLKMPISPNNGSNSMVIPSFFPIPFIMEGLYADNLVPGSITLYKNDFNCTTLSLQFNSTDPVNMTYELFGLNLPSNVDINNSAGSVTAKYTPTYIKNKFLQLPPSIDTYINTHPYFKSHLDALDLIIEDNDNAFIVANKIRNYLQTYFTIGFDALINDPPAEGEDVVEWFCEHEEGLWSEFASAFCAFTRAFNVSSRFIDGFHSQDIEQGSDEGKNYFAIKYLNLYNWAEIYVPTDISGDGMWVQMDIIFDSFGAGGNPMANYMIQVKSNFTGVRGKIANLTATLSSDTGSIDNKTITFTDLNSGLILGKANTTQNGTASILVKIDDSHVVGPHVISASYQLVNNYTVHTILGNVELNLTVVSPDVVNISKAFPDTPQVIGYIYDPLNNERVQYALVNFILVERGTNIIVPDPLTPAFSPSSTVTDNNGDFNEILTLEPVVPRGEYEIRVDFNGTWIHPLIPFPLIFSSITNSSNKIEFNVTEELTSILRFSINGTPTDYPYAPNPSNLINVKRGEQLNLSVTLIDESTMSPAPDEIVEFYDYTNGFIIGSDVTLSSGIASILYSIDEDHKSGPMLLYAKHGIDRNYSYSIVNEPVSINVLSYSDFEYDLAFPDQFNIRCELNDSSGNPIYYSLLDLRMNSTFDYTGYLIPPNPEYPTSPGSNFFNFNRDVIQSTPVNNYTLKVEFNGYFDFTSYPYPATFYLAYLYNSTELTRQLKVHNSNDVIIYLEVEGNPTTDVYDNFYRPERYTRGQIAKFNVTVVHGGDVPDLGDYVTIWDDYSNMLLDNYTYKGVTGYVQFNISTNKFYHAGIHKIRVQFMNYPTINTTFIIINETVNVNVNPVISVDNVVVRDIESFTVSGYVRGNGTGLRGLRVNLILLNKSSKYVSQYIIGTKTTTTLSDGYFQFNLASIDIDCTEGPYYIRVDFNGSIYLSGVPGIDLIDPNYMVTCSSSLVPLNITAGTVIIQDGYHTVPHDISEGYWWVDDTLYIYGNLTWDNGTAMAKMKVNVTVQLLNGEIIAFNDTVKTDQYGGFNASLIIDNSWPDYVSQTNIIVYFEPTLEYVEKTELQFT